MFLNMDNMYTGSVSLCRVGTTVSSTNVLQYLQSLYGTICQLHWQAVSCRVANQVSSWDASLTVVPGSRTDHDLSHSHLLAGLTVLLDLDSSLCALLDQD